MPKRVRKVNQTFLVEEAPNIFLSEKQAMERLNRQKAWIQQ